MFWTHYHGPKIIVTFRSIELLAQLGIEDLDLIMKERRLRWYGHVERSSDAVKTAFHIQVDGKHGPGRPKMTWKRWQREIAESGSSRLSTLMIDIPGSLVWDLPCVQQASYLEWGPLMWMLPLYLHVNQKSADDDDEPLKFDCTCILQWMMFVLRFYGPVNPMGSCRARSVYLATHLLGRLSPLSG